MAAVAAVATLASLGAGYTVAHTALSDSSAYVAKGNALEHVNGESHQPDAVSKALAKSGDPTTVVRIGDKVAVLDRKTNSLTVVDGATMSPTARIAPKGAHDPSSVTVVASGDRGWVIDQGASTVTQLVDGKPRRPITLSSKPLDAAPGPSGSVIVVSADGKLVRVQRDGTVHPIKTSDTRGASLTVAGGHTYLVTPGGVVAQVDGDSPQTVATVPGLAPGPSGRMLVGSIDGAGPHVLVISGDALEIVDPSTGKAAQLLALHSGSSQLGQPVEFGGRVYIPDFDTHRVLVVDEASMQVRSPIRVPGTASVFALFVSGRKLWANDQYSQHLLQLDRSGTRHNVDKGPGNGVHDDGAPLGGAHPNPTTKPVGAGPGLGGSGGTGGTGGTSGTGGTTGPPRSGSGGGGGEHQPTRYVRVPKFPAHTDYQQACTQIEALGPSCNPVSQQADGVTTDELISTQPGEGKKVPADGSVTVVYVGPAQVPTLPPGTTPDDGCKLVTAAGLRCTAAPSPEPAAEPAAYGTVGRLEPATGTPVDRGAKVTLYYYDAFTMPRLAGNGTRGTAACAALSSYPLVVHGRPAVRPQCTSVPGRPAPGNDRAKANVVYDQNVAQGTTYTPGSSGPIRLTVFSAQAKLTDYRVASGNTISATDAVDDCNKNFACALDTKNAPVPVDGQNNVHTEWIGKVAAMHDGRGRDVQPGLHRTGAATSVYLVQYTDNSTIPDVSGANADQACVRVRQAGFSCSGTDTKQPSRRNAGSVLSQSGVGPAKVGTPVTVNYSSVQPILLVAYRSNTDPQVWTVRLQTQSAPPGYGAASKPLGYAYAPNSGMATGAWQPVDMYCVAGPSACDGHAKNHMYTRAPLGRVQQLDGPRWTNTDPPPADLIPATSSVSCGPGQVGVWRSWVFNGGTHTYDVGNQVPPLTGQAGGGRELVGCTWPA